MIYCDTSLLVSAFTEESSSIVAVEWIDRQPENALAISGWNLTEFASAIAMKRHRGEIDDQEAALVEHGWQAFQAKLHVFDVVHADFAHAAELVATPPSGLRSGDALHLAILIERGCALATFDRHLAAAARTLGVTVHPD